MSLDVPEQPDAAPNTKYYNLPVPVPRDLAAYEPTDHFLNRKKYRQDPRIKTWVVEDVLQEGRCHGQVEPNRFRFTKEVWSEGIHEWSVIVALVDEAFLREDVNHELVTAFCPCHDPEEPDCR